MEYPPYPGCMNFRMRKAYKKWRDGFATPPAQDICDREIEYLWKLECENAIAEGKLKAIREKAYRDEIRKDSPAPMQLKNYHFVTVNPAPDTDLNVMETVVDSWVKQKYIESVEYVYEQRGDSEETMGQGMHIHAIVKTNTKPSDFKKRVSQKFRNLVGSEKHVYITPIKNEKWLNDKKAYIRGDKNGDGKKEKTSIDRIWRENNYLKEIYNHNNNSLNGGISESSSTSSSDHEEEEEDGQKVRSPIS